MNLLDKKCGLWAALVLRCHAAHLLPAAGAAVAAGLLGAPAHAQGSGVMTGTVLDTATKRPIPDCVVTVTSPALQGEQTVVTDKSGSYRIPNLPPGAYTLRLEGDGYKPYTRGGISMRLDSTIRVNAELLPEGIKAEEVVVVGKAPTVDVGSSSTGVTLNQEFTSRIALAPPGGKLGASRSFESLASVAPGANADLYGVSISGTTSPENAFLIDGVSVSDPAFGILGTPLSMEFIKEVGIITGGYLPEYGKAMGGIMDVVTKTGSNEFHGSAWFNITPGSIEGPRKGVSNLSSAITTNPRLGNVRDFGVDVGGPILKDKLWFYAGVQFSATTMKLERNISQFSYVSDMAGGFVQAKGADGLPITTPVTCPAGAACPAGTPASPVFFATESTIQYIGKLTYHINQDDNLTLSVYGTPTQSGGNGNYSFNNAGLILGTDAPNLTGSYSSLGTRFFSNSNDVSLKYSAAFNNKRQLLDVTLGWHHQHQGTQAADGSGPGDTGNPNVLAGVAGVLYRQNNPAAHSISDFEKVPAGSCPKVPVASSKACMADSDCGGTSTCNTSTHVCMVPTPTCPVGLSNYYSVGGPGFIDDILMDSYQGKAVFTDLLQLAGHHVIKAGVDFNFNSYQHQKAYSGGDLYREGTDGSYFSDFRKYGFVTGPDAVQPLDFYTAKTTTTSIGGFLQDSWQIFDKVTLNFGVRYDTQLIYGADGTLGLAIPNQWSPRVGVIYDFTQQGRSKLFANFARYYEGVPLDMADRSFPGEPTIVSIHNPASCNPATATGVKGCNTPPSAMDPGGGGRFPIGGTNTPSQYWARVGGAKEPVDPNVSPQSSDEFVVGGEYEVFSDARMGITYTHRYMNKAIEDMSRDEANTYFIGNPGYGIAADFPKAVRNYDAMTIYFNKAYANTWLFTATYTLSRLYGNYAGLFRPETGQLDPNITSDFDLRSLLANQMGPLPGDHTHSLKFYGAKDFLLPHGQDILLGLTYKALSGGPLNALGSHPIYGAGEAFVLPRGTGGTLNADGSVTQARGDWIHSIDLRLGYSTRLTKESTLGVTMDVFNIIGFQAATAYDQNYTFSDVLPCQPGTGTAPGCVKKADGTAFNPKTEVNPNYGHPTQYQAPRQFRFGAKVTF